MANNNVKKQVHVSPGIYFTESEISVANSSLGITNLGVVGETLKGPAFQPIDISSWGQFQSYFGGTSTEKFKGSQYPKYELPYIAKTYLEESQNLKVCRVLGLSGTNAGTAWIISAYKENGTESDTYTQDKPMVVAVLRSRGEHKKAAIVKEGVGNCPPEYKYDGIEYYAKNVQIVPSSTLSLSYADCDSTWVPTEQSYKITATNYGQFTLKVTLNAKDSDNNDIVKYYSVSLNPTDKNYIYNVIGGNPEIGEAEIYIEELYDVALKQLVEQGKIDCLGQTSGSSSDLDLATYNQFKLVPKYEPVVGVLEKDEALLTRKDYGKRFIAIKGVSSSQFEDGAIYKVTYEINSEGQRVYKYEKTNDVLSDKVVNDDDNIIEGCVYCTSENVYYTKHEEELVGGETNEDDGYELVDLNWKQDSAYGLGVDAATLRDLNIGDTVPVSAFNSNLEIGAPDTFSRPIFISQGDSVVKFTTTNDFIQTNVPIGAILKIPANSPGSPWWETEGTKLIFKSTQPNTTSVVDIKEDGYYSFGYYGMTEGLPVVKVRDMSKVFDIDLVWSNKTISSFENIENGEVVEVVDASAGELENNVWSQPVKIYKGEKYTITSKTQNWCILQTDKSEHPWGSTVRMYKNGNLMNGPAINLVIEFTETHEYSFGSKDEIISIKKAESKSEVKNGTYPITLDLNDYKEQFRYASTPWFVSEIKASADHVELAKLFRFHTISDGAGANTEVKVSIENIDPDNLTFDVIVRDFYDSDYSPAVLERYKNCNLVPGTPNYIGLKIGTFDETYETVSKYMTVEVIDSDVVKSSVPAGFLGFPVRCWAEYTPNTEQLPEEGLQKPELQYNTVVDPDIRVKKQYFGMSDLMGIDEDILKYKGVEAYNDLPEGLTPAFHLDARIFNGTPDENGVIEQDGITQTVTVDGVKGYSWITVNRNNFVGNSTTEPRIGTEAEMIDTIYEDKRYRKFTTCFYGGWDGWDYYRTSRSNSDEFYYQNYKDNVNKKSGEGETFSLIPEPEFLGFDASEKVISSDWYAYMGGIRQFANPKAIDINVFATPGIDYVNNKLLVENTIEMIEEERADSIYVVTTPDKPFGASDSRAEMYTAAEAVDNLEDSNIDSNWACTYYPWVKYYDSMNSQYIYLPPTKDVVKSFAYTDNTAYPWFSNAGWNRGLTDGVRSKKNLVLSEQDELYSGRINFINNFAEEGMRIWGDKNLQIEENSMLNRISKRRCLIRLRKLISISCIGLIFEPNDNTLAASLRSAIEPILEDFVSNRALYDAKLVIDDSQESRDRLELNAQIYLKFIPNAEYINIGLVATPNGVSFDDI